MPGWFIDLKAKCPVCGARVPNEHVPRQPRICPGCGVKLQISHAYLKRESWIGTALTAVAAALLAHGFWQGLLLFALLFFPVALAISEVGLRLFPPKLEPYDGHKMLG